MSQTSRIHTVLKRSLRAAGLTYADVARHLELSEASVKRLFAQESLSLKRLERIATLAGSSIADLVEPVFNELDKNGDGSVSFAELLRVLFPFASKEEFETMLSWVAKDAPKPPPKPKELSKEAQDELKAIFAAYDKDGNKVLSKGELKSAIGNIVDEDDIARMFKEADVDGSDTIDLKEFMEMMKTTGLWE